MDYNKLTMTFTHNGNVQRLQGVRHRGMEPLDNQELQQLTGQGYFLCLATQSEDTNVEPQQAVGLKQQEEDIQKILQDFPEVFS